MRLIFAGTPDVAVTALDALAESNHEVAAVITRPDARRGRGMQMVPSPVAARADKLGLHVMRPQTLHDSAFIEELVRLQPDCCPVVAYGGLVPRELLSVPPQGWVNLHFSLLPAWRGAAPVQHALLRGDEVTGATTFRLAAGLDTGPVYGTVTETVRPRDTTGDLLTRLAQIGAHLLVQTLDAIERGELSPHEQPSDGVSLAPKLTTDDARVRWGEPALAVDRRVRACTPAPGAWTEHRGLRLGVLPFAQASATETAPSLKAGELRATKHEAWVGTGSHAVLLGEVRPAGKGAMDAADWARGVRLVDGDVLT